MPYGISDDLWRRLPPDDQAAVIAGAKGQPAPAIGGYAPSAPTPAPSPNLVYGIPADLWRRLPPDDQAAVRAESMGEPPPAIGGYAPTLATPAPPPNLSAPGNSRTGPTGDYPAATTVTTPKRASSIKPNPSVGWRTTGRTLAAREAKVGQSGDMHRNPAHPLLAAREKWAVQYFVSKGLTRAQAAGVVGNLVVESGNYLNPAEPGGGIAQWGGSRLTKMTEFEGGKPDFSRQVEFVWHELTQNPGYGLNLLRNAKTPAQAAIIFMNNYEKPDPRVEHQSRRVENAQRINRGDYGAPA